MTIRVTTYLDENLVKKMDRYENKSKLVKEALNMYFINEDYFLSKKKEIENNIEDYKYKLDNERIKLEKIEQEIEMINKRKNIRPEGYLKSVSILRCLPDVNEEDLLFQAERLSVDAGQLKEWLWFDGFYEDIFKKSP